MLEEHAVLAHGAPARGFVPAGSARERKKVGADAAVRALEFAAKDGHVWGQGLGECYRVRREWPRAGSWGRGEDGQRGGGDVAGNRAVRRQGVQGRAGRRRRRGQDWAIGRICRRRRVWGGRRRRRGRCRRR
eukprot:2973294-Pleurochrysis_carterae.AAC.1